MTRIFGSNTVTLYTNKYLDNHTWPKFFDGISQVGSRVLQSSANPKATNHIAEAIGLEIFVNVKWAWLAYPLALLVCSTLLFLLTALASRRLPYLFKNSILAVLLHGLEGYDTTRHEPWPTVIKETEFEMKEAVESVRASLRKNKDGILKLKAD